MSDQERLAPRKIIHIDMDAFFASVEQRDDPSLRGKPVAVGGSARRGVVAAASYEARAFGVRSAMPSVTAKRRCPDLLFVKPRFEVYQQVSGQIRDIFAHFSDRVEPLSLDEAYLDVTDDKRDVGSATKTASLVREQIFAVTGLTASAGISYNKFLAKIASDQNKPNGMFAVRPGEGPDFVAGLPARRFHGVGPKTAERMARLGIHTGADLREKDMTFLETHFGKFAAYLHGACRGVDHRPVNADRIRKSIGGERTYGEDLQDECVLREVLAEIIEIVWGRIEDHRASGRTVTLKVKYMDFRQITRSRSVDRPIRTRTEFTALAEALLESVLPVEKGVRLLGLALSGLELPASGPMPENAAAEPRATQYRLEF